MILDIKLYTVTNGHGMMSNNRKNVHILYHSITSQKHQNGAWHFFHHSPIDSNVKHPNVWATTYVDYL